MLFYQHRLFKYCEQICIASYLINFVNLKVTLFNSTIRIAHVL